VGYLTTNVPMVLTTSQDMSTDQAIRTLRHHLQHIPHGGIGHGVLRYLASENDVVKRVRSLPVPEVKFNYLGALTAEGATQGLFLPIRAEFPGVVNREELRAYLHNLELSIVEGCLEVVWKFSTAIHRPETVKSLLEQYVEKLADLIREYRTDDENEILLKRERGAP
jgi:non-ribosomal peptide synthase protein (TIGR01720 family)